MSSPKITDVAIVAPDLEIPGNIAIACAIPIKKLFGVLYNDYLHAVCNPFAKVGSPINSPAFEKRVEDACKRAARLAVAP